MTADTPSTGRPGGQSMDGHRSRPYRAPLQCSACGRTVTYDTRECPRCRTGDFLQEVTLDV